VPLDKSHACGRARWRGAVEFTGGGERSQVKEGDGRWRVAVEGGGEQSKAGEQSKVKGSDRVESDRRWREAAGGRNRS
jgi:hypothetical protein